MGWRFTEKWVVHQENSISWIVVESFQAKLKTQEYWDDSDMVTNQICQSWRYW